MHAIEGFSPAISIDQKSTSHNPRSTVRTVTEIQDYLRLLFGRAGELIVPSANARSSPSRSMKWSINPAAAGAHNIEVVVDRLVAREGCRKGSMIPYAPP